MTTPTFWQYLALNSDELVAHGVPPREVVARRFAATGHVRPIGPRWLGSFGGWGSVLALDELAERVGVERQVVMDYAKAKGLRWATRERRHTHGELAIHLWCDRNRSPEASCARFGVFPGERRMLCAAAQALIDDGEGGIEPVLSWKVSELNARFEALNIALRPPLALLRAGALSQTETASLQAERLARLGAA